MVKPFGFFGLLVFLDFLGFAVAVADGVAALTGSSPPLGSTIWPIATATPRNAAVPSTPAIRRVQRAVRPRAGAAGDSAQP